jgi:hypothetical protein
MQLDRRCPSCGNGVDVAVGAFCPGCGTRLSPDALTEPEETGPIDKPRAALRYLMSQHGRSILDDPRRCEALMRDLCPESRREILLLVRAISERVPADLLGSRGGMPIQMFLAQLTKRLEDNLALSPDASRWTVESWALALGFVAPNELHQDHIDSLTPAARPSSTPPGHPASTAILVSHSQRSDTHVSVPARGPRVRISERHCRYPDGVPQLDRPSSPWASRTLVSGVSLVGYRILDRTLRGCRYLQGLAKRHQGPSSATVSGGRSALPCSIRWTI